ncbi:MAG UNVERIFIED_CONTAM: hypothetical protein LVT10_20690 [Anaerolineae bacterium]
MMVLPYLRSDDCPLCVHCHVGHAPVQGLKHEQQDQDRGGGREQREWNHAADEQRAHAGDNLAVGLVDDPPCGERPKDRGYRADQQGAP